MPTPQPTAAPPTESQPRRGGILTVSGGDPPNIDPIKAVTSQYYLHWGNIYSGLVQYNPRQPVNQIIPDLAESWEIGSDLTRYTFKMRPGVNWHDGQAFSAADAKWSLETLMAEGGHAAELPAIATIEAPDDGTLVLNLERPQASVLQILGLIFVPIVAQHVYEANGGDLSNGPNIGTGPFLEAEYQKGEAAELIRNPNYFETVDGTQLPYLDGVKTFMIRDLETSLAAFRAGRIMLLDPRVGIDRAQVERLKGSVPDLKPTPWDMLQISTLLINPDAEPWNDQRVRQAANLAIDRWEAVELNENLYKPAGPIVSPGWGLSDEELFALPGFRKGADKEQDREEARRLLAEAGFPDGFESELMHFTHAAWMQDLAVFAIDQLAKVGIRMKSNGLPLAEALDAWQQQAFNVTTFGHNISFPDPDATEKNVKPNIFHFLEDARLIELFDQQAVESDLDKRRELVTEMQRRMMETSAVIYIGWQENFSPVAPQVEGHEGGLGIWSRIRHHYVWLSDG